MNILEVNILMTSDGVGGVGVHADELAAGLAARGHRVTVAVLGDGRGGERPAGLRDGVERVWAPFALEWRSEMEVERLRGEIAAGRGFLAALGRRQKAELLHSNHFAYAGCMGGAPTLLAAHSDVVSWWRAVHGAAPPETGFHRWYREMAAASLERAEAVVAPSEAALEEVRTSFGYQGAGVAIANGMKAPARQPPRTGRTMAVSVGRLWDEAKQARLLCRDDLGLEVVLAGDDGGRKLPAVAGVRQVGAVGRAEVERWLGRARVYVAPSRYEPFGLAPLEAAWAGCALLLNDLASFREIWGGAASYFRHNDGEDLARQLRRMANEPEWTEQMGETARARAERCYGREAMVDRYEEQYGRLLGN